jgi:hypothetical protein
MADKFDPYREALVIETETVWPAECTDWSAHERRVFALRLHADPTRASTIHYVRQHAGFTRRITVTAADIARLAPQS